MRNLGTTMRALASLAAAAGLVVGVPLALILAVGWPGPAEVPDWATVSDALQRQDISTGVLIKALALVVWLAWAPLAWAIVVEAVAAARGRTAGHVMTWPGAQRLARKLVASAALLLTSLSGVKAAGASPLDPGIIVGAEAPADQDGGGELALDDADDLDGVVIRLGGLDRVDGPGSGAGAAIDLGSDTWDGGEFGAGADPGPGSGAPDWRSGTRLAGSMAPGGNAGAVATVVEAPDEGQRVAGAEVLHQVEQGDTFWGLAEQYLDSGLRWREIRDHNVGRAVAPDHALSASEDSLRVGWIIAIPRDDEVAAYIAPTLAPSAPSADRASAPGGEPDGAGAGAGVGADAGAEGTEADVSGDESAAGTADVGDAVPVAYVADPAADPELYAKPQAPTVPASAVQDPATVAQDDTDATEGDAEAAEGRDTGTSNGAGNTASPSGPTAVTVEPGDHFWALAERQLQQAWGREVTAEEIAPYWQELVDGNVDQLSSADPDVVYPGEQFAAPSAPADPAPGSQPAIDPAELEARDGGDADAGSADPGSSPDADPDAGTDTGADSAAGDTGTAEGESPGAGDASGAGDTGAGDAGAGDAGAGDAAGGTAESSENPGGEEAGTEESAAEDPGSDDPAGEQPAAEADGAESSEGSEGAEGTEGTDSAQAPAENLTDEVADEESTEDEGSSLLPVVVPLGASAVLAGLLLVALRRRRFARRRLLKPGQHIPSRQKEHADLERGMAVGAQDIYPTVAAASRGYGAALAANPALPMVTGMWVSPARDVTLQLAETATPEIPFERGPASDRWDLFLDELDLDPDMGPGPEPAASVLDTPAVIGRDDDGDWVVIDLESVGALEVDGDRDRASDLVRSIVAELALQPQAERMVDITAVGVDGLGSDVLEQGVVSLDRLDEDLVRRVERVAAETDSMQAHRGAAARAEGLPRDGLFVTVVALGGWAAPDPTLLERLAAAATPGGRGIAVVAVGSLGSGATRVLVERNGDARIPHMGVTVEAAQVQATDLLKVGQLLADEPEQYPSEPAEAMPESWPEWPDSWGEDSASVPGGWMGAWLPYSDDSEEGREAGTDRGEIHIPIGDPDEVFEGLEEEEEEEPVATASVTDLSSDAPPGDTAVGVETGDGSRAGGSRVTDAPDPPPPDITPVDMDTLDLTDPGIAPEVGEVVIDGSHPTDGRATSGLHAVPPLEPDEAEAEVDEAEPDEVEVEAEAEVDEAEPGAYEAVFEEAAEAADGTEADTGESGPAGDPAPTPPGPRPAGSVPTAVDGANQQADHEVGGPGGTTAAAVDHREPGELNVSEEAQWPDPAPLTIASAPGRGGAATAVEDPPGDMDGGGPVHIPPGPRAAGSVPADEVDLRDGNGAAPPYEPPAWELCVRVFADHLVETVDGGHVSFRYGQNPDVPNKNTHRGPELLAYLALSGRAATAEEVRDHLWWDRPVALGTVNKLVYGTRKVVGGADVLSHAQEDPLGRYRLVSTVATDAQLMVDALEYAKTVANRHPETAVDTLRPHLAAIETVAFRNGHLGQGLMEWASAFRVIDSVELPVIEAALLYARLSCERGRAGYHDALWGIDQGLRACPYNEALVRVAMEIEALLGNADAVNHRYLTLATRLARDELEPEPETSELRARLGGATRLRSAG